MTKNHRLKQWGVAFTLLLLSGEALRIHNQIKLNKDQFGYVLSNGLGGVKSATNGIDHDDLEGVAMLEVKSKNSVNDASIATFNSQVRSVQMYTDIFMQGIENGATSKEKWRAVTQLKDEITILQMQLAKLLKLNNDLPDCQKGQANDPKHINKCIDPELKDKLLHSVKGLFASHIPDLISSFMGAASNRTDMAKATSSVFSKTDCAASWKSTGEEKKESSQLKKFGACFDKMSKETDQVDEHKVHAELAKPPPTKGSDDWSWNGMKDYMGWLEVQAAETGGATVSAEQKIVGLLFHNLDFVFRSMILIGILMPIFAVLGIIFGAIIAFCYIISPRMAKRLLEPVAKKFMRNAHGAASWAIGNSVDRHYSRSRHF